MEEQTREIFRKFDALLKAAGGSCDDIVSTTDYITTTKDYSKTAAVRREFFRRGFPTATGVLVAGLLRPYAVIEISAIAVLNSAQADE
jgi:enamine deaminase RidA (YjgF/YER057c/UK114 family)